MSKDSLIIVTKNKNKLAEIAPLFREFGVTFENMALQKYEVRADSVDVVARVAAEHAYGEIGRPLVIEDTGFFIRALNGFPGVYPAFVFETIGRRGILKLMEGVQDRYAKFVTAVAFCDGHETETFIGEMEGYICDQEVGTGGFGYDPIFVPQGESKTYAQLSLEEKVAISHRTRAFRSFLKWYVSQ